MNKQPITTKIALFDFKYMNKNMEKYVNFPKIDSLKLTFRIDDLNWYDESVHDVWHLINKNTGEIDETFSRKNFKQVERNGVRYDVKFFSVHRNNFDDDKYIAIIIYSRQLYQDYFKGITVDTVKQLYNNVMNAKIINCDYDIFLNSSIRLFDIAIDSFCSIDIINPLSERLKKINCDKVPFSTFKVAGLVHSYQYGNREKSKNRCGYSYKEPFFKLYSKFEDMRDPNRPHVREFYRMIDFDVKNLKNYWRFEMSIKDASHLNQYLKRYTNEEPVKHITLNFMLQLLQDEHFVKMIRIDMLQMYVKKLLSPDLFKVEKKKKMQTFDIVLKNIVDDVCDKSNMNIDETVIYIMETFFKGLSCRKTRYNYKSKISQLVKLRLVQDMRESNNETLKDFLRPPENLHKDEKILFDSVIANLVL